MTPCSTSATQARLLCSDAGEHAVIPPFNDEGNLPQGRWVSDLDEVYTALVEAPAFESSSTRRECFEQLEKFLALAGKRFTIPAIFLGGTFVTAKIDPSDADFSALLDVSGFADMDPRYDVVKNLFLNGRARLHRCDPYWIPWRPSWTQADGDYARARGSWDDWWQRDVPKSSRGLELREHGMPRRGYLEVIVDGYA